MKFFTSRFRALSLCGLLAGALGLAACDPQAIKELEEGVSTEADVVQRFGQPERVWPEAGGAKTFEYNRQPEGMRNYMITIGPDGRMSALRQVLSPDNFRRVQAGMGQPGREALHVVRGHRGAQQHRASGLKRRGDAPRAEQHVFGLCSVYHAHDDRFAIHSKL